MSSYAKMPPQESLISTTVRSSEICFKAVSSQNKIWHKKTRNFT